MQRRGGGGFKWVCPTCVCSVKRGGCKECVPYSVKEEVGPSGWVLRAYVV